MYNKLIVSLYIFYLINYILLINNHSIIYLYTGTNDRVCMLTGNIQCIRTAIDMIHETLQASGSSSIIDTKSVSDYLFYTSNCIFNEFHSYRFDFL